MKEAAPDTKWQEATPSRLAIEILRGAAEEIVRHKAAGVPMNGDAIPVKASVLLSLLDRIEELERRDVFDAERAQTWNAAVALRGAVRVALDEWHKFTDHLDDSIAVHDILLNAYQDTAGKIP